MADPNAPEHILSSRIGGEPRYQVIGNPRTLWRREAELTDWLADNLDQLASCLGLLHLEYAGREVVIGERWITTDLAGHEQTVGGMRVDLTARDEHVRLVIIEAKSDPPTTPTWAVNFSRSWHFSAIDGTALTSRDQRCDVVAGQMAAICSWRRRVPWLGCDGCGWRISGGVVEIGDGATGYARDDDQLDLVWNPLADSRSGRRCVVVAPVWAAMEGS
jgi:hypothetical protein